MMSRLDASKGCPEELAGRVNVALAAPATATLLSPIVEADLQVGLISISPACR
jgi:hypothetical protein